MYNGGVVINRYQIDIRKVFRMNKKDTALFSAIDIAYNDPDIKDNADLSKILLDSAKALQNGGNRQTIKTKLNNAIVGYSLTHNMTLPTAIVKLHQMISPSAELSRGIPAIDQWLSR